MTIDARNLTSVFRAADTELRWSINCRTFPSIGDESIDRPTGEKIQMQIRRAAIIAADDDSAIFIAHGPTGWLGISIVAVAGGS